MLNLRTRRASILAFTQSGARILRNPERIILLMAVMLVSSPVLGSAFTVEDTCHRFSLVGSIDPLLEQNRSFPRPRTVEPPVPFRASLDASTSLLARSDLLPQVSDLLHTGPTDPGHDGRVSKATSRGLFYGSRKGWTARPRYSHLLLSSLSTGNAYAANRWDDLSIERQRPMYLQMSWQLPLASLDLGYHAESPTLSGGGGLGPIGMFTSGADTVHSFTLGVTRKWGRSK